MRALLIDLIVLSYLVYVAHWGSRHCGSLLLRLVGDYCFGRQEKACDTGGVLQRRAGYPGRVDDAGLNKILVCFSLDVEAEIILPVSDLPEYDGAFESCVVDNPSQRLFERFLPQPSTSMIRTLEAPFSSAVSWKHIGYNPVD